MEKVIKTIDYYKSYPIVRLYKNDLEQINQLFLDNFSEIEIEANEYKLNDISEINNFNKEKIYNFNIKGYDKANSSILRELKMSFKIENKRTTIYINYDDTKCFGVQSKLDNILKKRISKLNILNSYIIPVIFGFILFSILFYYKALFEYIIFIMFLSYIITFVISFKLLLSSLIGLFSNSIYIEYSWEKQSFFQRNRDNIIVGGSCALFGTVIGGLIVYFVINKLSRQSNP